MSAGKMPLQQVHLRINDAATGKPTPVRLRVTDAGGNYYPPNGHPAEFATGVGEDVGGNLLLDGKKWAYIDGSCEIALPVGELLVEAVKGPNYLPLRESIILPLGKLALRFAIKCPVDWRRTGLISGDSRAHFISPHTALLEAAAEDLAIVNLLAAETQLLGRDGQAYRACPNLLAFSGQQPCLDVGGQLVVVNTLNSHAILGTLALLNCHRVIFPLSFGGPDQTDDWSLADWCGQCHRKNGLVVWIDPFTQNVNHAGEALANLILGEVDSIEMDLKDHARIDAWYHLLNAGIRVGIVGASGRDRNHTPLGVPRTYARKKIGESFSYSVWVEAVREGRTFVSSGPILAFHVQGESEGTVHYRGDRATRLRVHFFAYSLGSLEKVDVVANGAVIASGDGSEEFMDVDLASGGWLAARCWQGSRIVAHSSPQYVCVDGVPPPIDPAAVAFLDGHLLRARQWVETEGRFNKPKSREHLLGIFDAARDVLRNGSAKRR